MSAIGRKLTNSVSKVGRKLQNAERIGKKLAGQGLKTSRQLSHSADVAGRKVANVAGRVNAGIGAVQPYLSGIPGVEQLATLGRDASKGVQLASQGARKGAQLVEKESRLGEKALKEVPNFI